MLLLFECLIYPYKSTPFLFVLLKKICVKKIKERKVFKFFGFGFYSVSMIVSWSFFFNFKYLVDGLSYIINKNVSIEATATDSLSFKEISKHIVYIQPYIIITKTISKTIYIIPAIRYIKPRLSLLSLMITPLKFIPTTIFIVLFTINAPSSPFVPIIPEPEISKPHTLCIVATHTVLAHFSIRSEETHFILPLQLYESYRYHA